MWGKRVSLIIVFFVASHCQIKQTYYSELTTMDDHSSLAVSYHDSIDIFQCGLLCQEDTFCVRFFYNSVSKHCKGVHIMKREGGVYETAIFSPSDMYRRENCEVDWILFNGHCYFYGRTIVTWSDARVECLDMSSYLVEIESQMESDWLAKTFLFKETCTSGPFTCSAWTGGNDLNIEGQYIWDYSNTTFNFTNWMPGEPSLANPSKAFEKNCIDLLKNGEWNDRFCTLVLPFLCEKSWK